VLSHWSFCYCGRIWDLGSGPLASPLCTCKPDRSAVLSVNAGSICLQVISHLLRHNIYFGKTFTCFLCFCSNGFLYRRAIVQWHKASCYGSIEGHFAIEGRRQYTTTSLIEVVYATSTRLRAFYDVTQFIVEFMHVKENVL